MPTYEELHHNLVNRHHAANVMGMDPYELRSEAEKIGIDSAGGFHTHDLIRLCAKLTAMTYDAERKAKLHAALMTFRAERDRQAA